jgi:hypothetical protein
MGLPVPEKAHGRSPCRFLKSTHTIEILLMRAVQVGLGFRIHPRRSNCTDRLGDIIRAKSSSQDYGRLDGLYDASADRPIVGNP